MEKPENQNEIDYWREVKTISQERLETARRILGEWATPRHLKEVTDEQHKVQIEFIQHYGAGNEHRQPINKPIKENEL